MLLGIKNAKLLPFAPNRYGITLFLTHLFFLFRSIIIIIIIHLLYSTTKHIYNLKYECRFISPTPGTAYRKMLYVICDYTDVVGNF